MTASKFKGELAPELKEGLKTQSIPHNEFARIWTENSSRLDFDLTEDLIVITSMAGDEHIDYVEFRRISSVGTFDRKASPISG
jgi:hypothetical protein